MNEFHIINKGLFGRRSFVFVFFLKYEYNFQKIECENSFQIIIFTLYVFGSYIYEQFSKY